MIATSATKTSRTDPSGVQRAVESLASLRFTVVLFGLAIFLVFVGTLAQVDHDIWFVVDHAYFRVWVANVEWQAFYRLAEMFTKAEPQPISGGFWFPGGRTIGVLLMANLLAAHSIRFRVAARGARLLSGIGVILAGVAATTWVIVSGMDDALESQLSPGFCSGLWQTLKALLTGVSLVGAGWSIRSYGRVGFAEWGLAAAGNFSLLIASIWLMANPDAVIDESGMRILWQLAKGTGAALLLLLGCWMVFRKRAGIVLLHGGIGLLMVGELATDLTADEAQMRINEGETVNYAYDIRSIELAVATPDGDADKYTVIPESILARAARSGEAIEHEQLPFRVRVLRFDENSMLKLASSVEKNLATNGAGKNIIALPVKSAVGVGPDTSVNLPSAYVQLLPLEGEEPLGVWMVSSSFLEGSEGGALRPQRVEHDGKSHEIELRFERHYKDYSVTLVDFQFNRYVGTNTPKDFSSQIILKDPSRNVERPVRIWMNNPLRFAGDTLYQADYDKATEATSVFQVTTNAGWMIPYVSCMLVGVGMLAHFLVTLSRFVRRRSEEADRLTVKEGGGGVGLASLLRPASWRSAAVWAPALVAVLTAGYLASKARQKPIEADGFDLSRFGRVAIADDGRVKPIDTLARITLQYLSGRQEVLPAEQGGGRTPAIQWLLDTITFSEAGRDYRVFRIENLELLDLLGLERRVGSYRYSYNEVIRKEQELVQQRDLAVAVPEESRTLVQKSTLELVSKVSAVHQLVDSFGSPQISSDPSQMRASLDAVQQNVMRLRSTNAPRSVAPASGETEWRTLFEAEFTDLLRMARGLETNPATAALAGAINAYGDGDPEQFSKSLDQLEVALAAYEDSLSDGEPTEGLASSERLSRSKIAFEQFFSAFSPFYYCAATYLIAFVLLAASWLGQPGSGWCKTLGRCATSVVVVTLLVHTFAVIARVYISGRPPVTTLYSSAVFIGWAAALFGVAFEGIYRLGVGTAVSSILGFLTLLVAHFLSLDGDTFTVLQAVLDTQFWLATHVVCITLGYSTTYLAGFLALVYLLAGVAVGRLDKHACDQLIRMTYGTLCFALFFSFIGTVLGGLWADDSWGRFWGWDPKENGALIIVLWNALILHARWGKMIDRVGLAQLAVAGNIVTSWSWFGVNELGVGLHSYGFTEGRTFWLLMFVLSQLAVMALGGAMAYSRSGPTKQDVSHSA